MTRQNSPDLLDCVVRIPEHVVHRAFAAETVVLNIKTGRYHGLNPVAGNMLETLERFGGVRESAAYLAELYGQPLAVIEADLTTLCEELAERGLIIVERARA
jgi:hypothetical protein